MAEEEKEEIDKLKQYLGVLDSISINELISQKDWGKINFKEIGDDLRQLKNTATSLTKLPINELPKSVIRTLNARLESMSNTFSAWRSFDIQNSKQSDIRKQIIENFPAEADNFYSQAALWIPYLAFRAGDVTSIEAINDAIRETKLKTEEELKEISAKKIEANNIVSSIRQTSGQAGAAVFTEEFEEQSQENKKDAKNWLWGTGLFLFLSLSFGYFIWQEAKESIHDEKNILLVFLVQSFMAKLILLSLLVSGVVWCGRQYRILKHLSVVNRHRALSLMTLQAFMSAVKDEQAKDVVVVESARAIFQSGQTGYLDSSDGGVVTPLQILEITKKLKSD